MNNINKEVEKILESIEIDEKENLLFDLGRRVIAANPEEARQIIVELNFKEKTHGVGHNLFDNQPYYYLFEAYALYLCNNKGEAIDRASRATSLFHLRNSQWNEALVHWFLSILYDENDQKEESCKELQKATAILEGLAKGFQQKGQIENCQSCQFLLRKLYRFIVLREPIEDLVSAPDKKGYLVPSWMPVFEKIQPNENDVLTWAKPPQNISPEIQLIIIGERWYSIKSVKTDKEKILLDSDKDYGWAKVYGHDMNAAQPVEIEEGDYVLFIKQGEVGNNEIVIVSRWSDLQKKEYTHIIRKLSDDKLLFADSLEKGDKYKPLLLSDNTQIMGYVVAVAKPIKNHGIETSLVLEQSKDILIPSSKLTPDFLGKILTPYLEAIASIQKIIYEILEQIPIEIEIKIISQFSPVSIGLKGVEPVVKLLLEEIIPWRRKNAQKMARQFEEEVAVDIEIKREELKEKRESNELRQELHLEFHHIMAARTAALMGSYLTNENKQFQLDRLYPNFDTIAFSLLDITSMNGKDLLQSPHEEPQIPSMLSFSGAGVESSSGYEKIDFMENNIDRETMGVSKDTPKKGSPHSLSSQEKELYLALVSMVEGDADRVKDLLKYEYDHAPLNSREEQLRNAIRKLEQDKHSS